MEARLEKLLREAPGPAPWYWQSFPPFQNSRESWSWRLEPTGGEIGEWPTLQRDSDGARCFVPGFYCYPVDAGNGHLLATRSRRSGAVEIRLHRVESLEPIEVPNDHPRQEADTYSPRAVEAMRIPRLAAGVHEGFALRTPVDLDELLLLARPHPSTDHDPALAIYAWDRRAGRVSVLPQPWFTAATHDLGYEWVTKVARDRRSARIVGAGIRVPAFELEDDGTTVRRWLTDPWGQPIAAERRDQADP
jgi:hypothetical protein